MKKRIVLSVLAAVILVAAALAASAASSPFKDVKAGEWYEESVNYVYENKLMNGMTAVTFEPETPMDRAMLVTVLYRAEGSPAVTASTPFNDLKEDWYVKPVAWAYENKVVYGTSDVTFSPSTPITREQIATIFYRFAGSKGRDTSVKADISSFPDAAKVSDYAKDAVSWAVGVGLIKGNAIGGKTLVDPQGNATRAQVATILMRYLESGKPDTRTLREKIDEMLDTYLCVTHGDLNIQFAYTGASVSEENMANILKSITGLSDDCTVEFDDFENDVKKFYSGFGDGQYVPVGELDVTFSDPSTGETETVPIKFSIRKILPSGEAGFPNGALGICPEDRNPEFVLAGSKLGVPATLEERKVYDFDGEFTPEAIEEFFREMTGLSDANTYPFYITGATIAQIRAGEPFYPCFVDTKAPDGRADLIWVRAVLDQPLDILIPNRLEEVACIYHNHVYFLFGTSSTLTVENLARAFTETFGANAEITDGFDDIKADYGGQGPGYGAGDFIDVTFTRGDESYEAEFFLSLVKQPFLTFTGALEGGTLGFCWDDIPEEFQHGIGVVEYYEDAPIVLTADKMNEAGIEEFLREKTGLTDEIYKFYMAWIEDGKAYVCFTYTDPVTGQMTATGAGADIIVH